MADRPPAGRRGGSGLPMAATTGESVTVPQHAIDVAIAQAARARLLRVYRAQKIDGSKFAQMTGRIYYMAVRECRQLGCDPYHTLSPNARRTLTRAIGNDADAVIERAKDNAGIGSLADWAHDPTLLPKKPPGRAT